MTEINNTTNEVVEKATEVATEVTESVVEKAGFSCGKVAGIVGGMLIVGGLVYGTVKFIKGKKAKDETGEEASEVVNSEEVEGDSEETAE